MSVAFERQTTRELVSADGDDFERLSAFFGVVQRVLGLAVHHAYVNVREDIGQLGEDFDPREGGWPLLRLGELGGDRLGGGDEVGFPECAQFVEQRLMVDAAGDPKLHLLDEVFDLAVHFLLD